MTPHEDASMIADQIEAAFCGLEQKRELLSARLGEARTPTGFSPDLLQRNALLVTELRERRVPVFAGVAIDDDGA